MMIYQANMKISKRVTLFKPLDAQIKSCHRGQRIWYPGKLVRANYGKYSKIICVTHSQNLSSVNRKLDSVRTPLFPSHRTHFDKMKHYTRTRTHRHKSGSSLSLISSFDTVNILFPSICSFTRRSLSLINMHAHTHALSHSRAG